VPKGFCRYSIRCLLPGKMEGIGKRRKRKKASGGDSRRKEKIQKPKTASDFRANGLFGRILPKRTVSKCGKRAVTEGPFKIRGRAEKEGTAWGPLGLLLVLSRDKPCVLCLAS